MGLFIVHLLRMRIVTCATHASKFLKQPTSCEYRELGYTPLIWETEPSEI